MQITGNAIFVHLVVIWSDMLGGVQHWQDTLPRDAPSQHCRADWERRKTTQTTECSMQWSYV